MPLWLLKVGGFFKWLSLKTYLIMGAVILALLLVWKLMDALQDHAQYVRSLETENQAYKEANERLNGRVNELASINSSNKATYEETLRQAQEARRIAEEERLAAEQRANHYRSIRDAAKSSPAEDRRSVSPVVRDTVDRLWGHTEGPAGSPNSGS